jgi:hypothetical protein
MMSYKTTLRRILRILRGESVPAPSPDITTTDPQLNDSKEILAKKWERALRGEGSEPAEPEPDEGFEMHHPGDG